MVLAFVPGGGAWVGSLRMYESEVSLLRENPPRLQEVEDPVAELRGGGGHPGTGDLPHILHGDQRRGAGGQLHERQKRRIRSTG